MKTSSLVIAAFIGAVVIIWEVPFIGTRSGLWQPLMLLGLGILLLAVAQLRHGG